MPGGAPHNPRAADGRGHLLDGAVWGMIGEGLAFPTGLATVVLLTRSFGATDYGLYTLTVGFVLLLQAGISSLLGRATVKFASEALDPDPVGVTVLRLHIALGGVLAVAVALTAPLVASVLAEPALVGYLRIFAVSLPLEAAADAHVWLLVGRGRYRRRALARGAYWVARPVLIVGPVLAGYGIAGALVGAVMAPLAALVVARRVVRPRLLGRGIAPAPLLAFATPLFLSGVAGLLARRLDLFALKAFGASAADAGLYASAQNLAWLPAMLATAFSPLLLSSMNRSLAEGRPERARSLAADFLRGPLWLLPLAAATAGAASQITRFAYGAEFTEAGTVLAWLIFAGTAVTLASTASVVFIVLDRLGTMVAASTLPLVVAVIGYPLLIPPFGGEGAAAATLLGTTAGMCFGLAMVYRRWRVAPPWRTAVRAVALSPLAWLAAGMGPTTGLGLVVKLSVIALGVGVSFAALGEFSADEVRGLARALKRTER